MPPAITRNVGGAWWPLSKRLTMDEEIGRLCCTKARVNDYSDFYVTYVERHEFAGVDNLIIFDWIFMGLISYN